MFQILDSCGGFLPIVKILAKVVKIVHILIPIALIVFGTFDLGKAVISSDDKKIKEAQGHLIKRVIYAVIIFLIPYIVGIIMSLVSEANTDSQDENNKVDITDNTDYSQCWSQAWDGKN